MIISFFLIVLLTFLIFTAVVGFGKTSIALFNLKNDLLDEFKLIEFIFGLIVLGFFGILINFFIKIDDFITYLFLFIGFILYLNYFLRINHKRNELIIIFTIILISIIFSFYSLSNDDFDYHFKTMQNFKKFPINDFILDRRIKYNSHWLMVNAVFYINKLPLTVFCLTSLLYSLALVDFFNSFLRNKKNKNYLALVYSFFIIIFLLGVINLYKEYGTDFPGQLIILFIFLIYFEKYPLTSSVKESSVFIILLSLAFFSISLKIINIFILLLLFIIFIQIKRKLFVLFISLISSIPILLWFVQNYMISKCLIWPLYYTCFENYNEAQYEFFLVESYAKSILEIGLPQNQIEILLSSFLWIPIWFQNHFIKILEVYLTYFILLFIPVIIFYFINRNKISSENVKKDKSKFFSIKNHYLIFSFIAFSSSLIWFLKAPGYRFGIAYNLNFLIIFLMPFWYKIAKIDIKFFIKSSTILYIVGVLFFIFVNILKIEDYIGRFGWVWPNIFDDKYIYK